MPPQSASRPTSVADTPTAPTSVSQASLPVMPAPAEPQNILQNILRPEGPPSPPNGAEPPGETPASSPFLPVKKRWLLLIAALAAAVIAVGGAYWFGVHAQNKTEERAERTTVSKGISLPAGATITAECTDMRGKQYIVPKDIPMGPVYDVYQGKVIAIEYLVGQTELAQKADMFANLALPASTYDHLTLMPMAPHAGENEAHFHVIAYLISATAAAKISCGNAGSSDTMNM